LGSRERETVHQGRQLTKPRHRPIRPSGAGRGRQPNAYCHNNPGALSCQPSRPSVAVVIGAQLILAPSQAELDLAIHDEFQCNDDNWDGPGGCASVANSPGIAPGIAAGICEKNPAWCTLQDLTMATLTTGSGGVGWGGFGKNGKPPHSAVVKILTATNKRSPSGHSRGEA
jgi:hypothetical protein